MHDMAHSDVLTFVRNDFSGILRNIRYLSKEDQELLLGYYIIGKNQTNLAVIHGSTQSICSLKINMAILRLSFFLLCGH